MKVLVLALAVALALVAAPSALADKLPKGGLPSNEEIFSGGRFEVTQQQVEKAQIPARSADERIAVAAASACWEIRYTYRKDGWWGYWQVWHQTYWCGGAPYVITYRSTQDGASSGGACAVTGGANSWRASGGVGQWYVDVQTQASFGCFVGWNNGSPWFNVKYTAGGSYFLQGYGER